MKEKWKVYINGVPSRGDEVIKVLTDLGAEKDIFLSGTYSDYIYFIGHNGEIHYFLRSCEAAKVIMDNYKEIKLPEKWKDGDILINNDRTDYKVFSDYDLSHINKFYAYKVSISIMNEKIISNKGCVLVCDRKDYRLATPSEVEHFYEILHKHSKDWDVEKKQLVDWKWKPKEKKVYWHICSDGHLVSNTFENDEFDIDLYNFGNCFRTAEEAEFMAEKIKKLLKGEQQ